MVRNELFQKRKKKKKEKNYSDWDALSPSPLIITGRDMNI